MVQIKFKKLVEGAIQPTRANPGDAGWDIRALEKVILPANSVGAVRTGLAVEIPEGYELQVRGKSGNALKEGLSIAQGVGTIDSGFRGEVVVLIRNSNPFSKSIDVSEMVAQLVLNELPESEFVEVKELTETVRGDKGLGSTQKAEKAAQQKKA